MNTQLLYALAIGIGIVAGLRSFTAPAAVSWAVHLGWLNLRDSPLAFIGATLTVMIFTLMAVGELIGDKLPITPKRTAIAPLLARIVIGGLCGVCLLAGANQSLLAGALLGGAGAVIGAFGGYEIRSRVVRNLNVKDIFVALCEDIVAIGLAFLLVVVTSNHLGG